MVFGGHQAILFGMASPLPPPPKKKKHTHTHHHHHHHPPQKCHTLYFVRVFKTDTVFMCSSINDQDCYQVFLNLVKHELLIYLVEKYEKNMKRQTDPYDEEVNGKE